MTGFWLRYQESGTHRLGNSSWLGWGWMLIGFLTFKCGTFELNLTQVLSWTEQQVSSHPIHRCHPGPTLLSWCVSFFKSFQVNGYSHPFKMCLELRRDTKNFPVHLENLKGLNACLRRVYQNEWLRKVRLWTLSSRKMPKKVTPWGPQKFLYHSVTRSSSLSHMFTRSFSLIYLHKVMHVVFLPPQGIVFCTKLPRVCSLTTPSWRHFLSYSFLRT